MIYSGCDHVNMGIQPWIYLATICIDDSHLYPRLYLPSPNAVHLQEKLSMALVFKGGC